MRPILSTRPSATRRFAKATSCTSAASRSTTRLMHRCFDGASKAHNAGDGARAKELSNEGHAHQAEQKRCASRAVAALTAQLERPGIGDDLLYE